MTSTAGIREKLFVLLSEKHYLNSKSEFCTCGSHS